MQLVTESCGFAKRSIKTDQGNYCNELGRGSERLFLWSVCTLSREACVCTVTPSDEGGSEYKLGNRVYQRVGHCLWQTRIAELHSCLRRWPGVTSGTYITQVSCS